MRIAFLILNHRPPTQLLRLIKTIRRELPDSPVVVHHDEFAAELNRSLLDFDDNAFLLTTGTPISWGDFGVVDAYWQCLSWMGENVDFDYVVLLSGQDYPGRRSRHTPSTAAEPCWFGSTWLTLSRRAAGFVVSSVRDRPDFVDYYRRAAHSDEYATATLVCNAPWARVERRDLHHVRWTDPRAGHPDVFRAEDLPELLAAPGYFARKFDIATDARILDHLDQVLAQAAVSAPARRDG